MFAYLVPLNQRDPMVAGELLKTLVFGGVEIHTAQKAFTADGVDYCASTYLILMDQPYSAFAKTLLEQQHYPDLRLFPGGPPKHPYDITAHSLPIQMGVSAIEVKTRFKVEIMPSTTVPRFISPPLARGVEGHPGAWASSRLCLRPALALSYGYGIFTVRDFHPRDSAHAGRTHEGAVAVTAPLHVNGTTEPPAV